MNRREETPLALEALALAAQRGREVEAEAVHVHLADPVAQAVEHHAQHFRVVHVQRVAAARPVDVIAQVLGREPVVAQVVDAAHRQGGAAVAALRRVIEHHVEDDLEPRSVHGAHQLAELAHRVGERVTGVRREKGQRVVAPVIHQAPFPQVGLGDELLHRHELHRRDAEINQVLQHRRLRQPEVGAAQVRRHVRVQAGKSLHMQLVDDGLVQRRAGRTIAAPVEGVRIDHPRLGHAARAVADVLAPLLGGAATEAVDLAAVAQLAHEHAGVRIEQQLVLVEAMALARRIAPVDAIPIDQAGAHAGQEAVPDIASTCRQREPRQLAPPGCIEQAELHRLGVGREQREVDAVAGPGGAHRHGPPLRHGGRCAGWRHQRSGTR